MRIKQKREKVYICYSFEFLIKTQI